MLDSILSEKRFQKQCHNRTVKQHDLGEIALSLLTLNRDSLTELLCAGFLESDDLNRDDFPGWELTAKGNRIEDEFGMIAVNDNKRDRLGNRGVLDECC